MSHLDTAFAWTKPVPRPWQEDLARLNVGDNVSSLHLSWLSGWPWAPVARWVIYEVTPASAVNRILTQEELCGITDSPTRGIWEALNGPDPRKWGRWVKDKSVPDHMGGQRWKSNSMVSQNAWKLHKTTGGLPQLVWIIEGTNGGHAWQMGNLEKHCLSLMGADQDDVQRMAEAWPDPGDLPYADYDQRTFNALAERDKLASWHKSIRFDDRIDRYHAADILSAEEKANHREMMQRVFKWVGDQVAGIVSDIPRSRLPARSDLRAAAHGDVVDVDAEYERMLND